MRLSRLTNEEFSPRNEAGVFFVVVVADGVELLAELEVLLDDSGSRSSSNDPGERSWMKLALGYNLNEAVAYHHC